MLKIPSCFTCGISLNNSPSTVDLIDCPRNEAGVVTQQESYHLRNLGRIRFSRNWHACDFSVKIFAPTVFALVSGGYRCQHGSFDEAGCNSVYSDVLETGAGTVLFGSNSGECILVTVSVGMPGSRDF